MTQAVRALLDEVRASLPGDAQLNILYDRSDYKNASIHDVEITLLITLVLVVIVVILSCAICRQPSYGDRAARLADRHPRRYEAARLQPQQLSRSP